MNTFASAAVTDRVIAMMVADAERGPTIADARRRSCGAAGVAPEPAPALEAGGVSTAADVRRNRDARASEPVMDRLLFGDNQFFGVNHMSEEKARAQAMRFQDIDAIIEVLDAAYDEGVRTFMCTTHDRIALICDHVRAEPERYARLRLLSRACPTPTSTPTRSPRTGCSARCKRFLPDEGLLERGDPRRQLAGDEGHRGDDDPADRRRDEDVRRGCGRRSSSCRTSSSTCCSGWASTMRSGSSPSTCRSATAPSPASSR